MPFAKLEGRIKEMYGSRRAFCRVVGINETPLCLKLKGINEFKLSEIHRICDMLQIPRQDMGLFF